MYRISEISELLSRIILTWWLPMTRQQFHHIPGLLLHRDFFTPEHCESLVQDSLALFDRLEASRNNAILELAHIPQPAYVRSQQHNLQSDEYFTRVELHERDRKIHCEYFPRYGEDGHGLCYFQRNSNIPDFVVDSLLTEVHAMIVSEGFVEPEQELTWKLTMNFYQHANGRVAGFPFHVDIPSNGVVTMILNIQREVLFQIANNENAVTDIPLPVGSLLLLSGESRYEWKHRVLPSDAPTTGGHRVQRVSLVLGFQ
jgi:hypothetical protein